MATQAFNEEMKRLNSLKAGLENGEIAVESLSPEDMLLLDFIYQLEILMIEDEISYQRDVLDEYKEELREAINYLKNRKV